MYTADLHEILNEVEYGGKASGLSKMIAFGIEVPKGFAIHKSAADDYLENNAYSDRFIEELKSRLQLLTSKELIVRSSAIGEDSADHSFAGQLDSFVVPNDLDECLKAVSLCRDSLKNDRVLAYQKESGYNLAGIGIVVQEYIESEVSGVLFTQSPFDEDEIYIEFVEGAGELLVSGKVNPKTITSPYIDDNYNKIKNTLFDHASLIEKSKQLKETLDYHIDVEWVYAGGKISFVQVRPITSLPRSKVYWSNTNLNENYPSAISPLLFSVARDSYYHYFKNLAKLLQIKDDSIRELEYSFSNTVGTFANRIYYNMSSIHDILALSPLRSFFRDAFNTFVGYAEDSNKTSKLSSVFSKLTFVKNLIKLNFSLEKNAVKIEDKVDSFSDNVENADHLKQYARCFYEFLDIRFNQWYSASLADMFAMIYYKLLGVFTKRIYLEDNPGIHNVLVQAIPDLISSKPLISSWNIIQEIKKDPNLLRIFQEKTSSEVLNEILTNSDWNSVKIKFIDHLNIWGFRCSGELMLTSDNYIEYPEKYIELLKSYIKYSQKSPVEIIAKNRKDSSAAAKKLILGIIKKRHILFPIALIEIMILLFITKQSKASISYRERVRYKQAKMYYNFSRIIKKIGQEFVKSGLLNTARDIIYLSYKEIGELLSSSNMFSNICAETVERRKQEHIKESKKQFPDNIISYFGEALEIDATEEADIEIKSEFEGLAVSGGVIKGNIKVLESVMEADKLVQGDILVTKQTDPGWAVVFPLIGGLIVELGGALSHGSIVAREFGIPAVAGVANITKMLKDNDLVILDGNSGKIKKI